MLRTTNQTMVFMATLFMTTVSSAEMDLPLSDDHAKWIQNNGDIQVSDEIQRSIENLEHQEPDQSQVQWAKDNMNPVVTKEVQSRLDKVVEHVQSESWQQKQEDHLSNIRSQLGLTDPNKGKDSEVPLQDRVVLFISESMPMHVLRRYAKDIEKVGGLMVLRGMKGGISKMQPTVQLIGDILKIDESCHGPRCAMRSTSIIVDPVLFRKNNIIKVPAAIYLEDMDINSYCERDDPESTNDTSLHVVYGDASLHGLMNEYLDLSKNEKVESVVRILRGESHDQS